jgi:Cu+-exporting ATPase
MGKPKVSEFIFTDLLQGIDQSCFWKLVSSIESASDHPLAKAVVEFIEQMNLEPNLLEPGYSVNNISETGGRGLLGKFGEKNEHSIFVGNQEWMLDNGISISEYQHKIDSWTMLGKSIVLIGIEMNSEKQTKFIAGLLSISDIIRPESRAVVEELKNMGIDVWMITGDHENTAKAVAEAVGIFPLNILSHVLPEEKYERIKELQSKCRLNEKVAMVGDGINDSVAIAQADVGIAIGTGSDIAIEAADVILVKSTLFDVITLIDLSRIVIKRIKLNFLWAFGFNFCGIPLAAGMFFCVGVELAPWIAGLAMAFSSVSVVCSSLLLNTYKAPSI